MKAVAIKDLAPLFTKASLTAELADEALYGMTVDVLGEEDGDFIKITTPYRYSGISPSSCFLFDESRVCAWEASKKWTVWVNYLDVKAEPDVIAPALAGLPRGGLLAVLAGENDELGWTKVGLPDGRQGYVKTPCVKPQVTSWSKEDEKALRRALTDTARLYAGTQYRWGGKTPLGIDCSGLTSISYLLNGIAIYRDASIREGFEMREIPLEEMKEGDLIFFKGHVAMNLGSGDFIHSTAYRHSPGVTINSLNPCSPIHRPDLIPLIKTAGSIF
jgi:hypothetical protein